MVLIEDEGAQSISQVLKPFNVWWKIRQKLVLKTSSPSFYERQKISTFLDILQAQIRDGCIPVRLCSRVDFPPLASTCGAALMNIFWRLFHRMKRVGGSELLWVWKMGEGKVWVRERICSCIYRQSVSDNCNKKKYLEPTYAIKVKYSSSAA
jgi:hypothetical protein